MITPAEILKLSPARLRAALSPQLARQPGLADRLTAALGYAPRWGNMTAAGFAAVALAWAEIAADDQQLDPMPYAAACAALTGFVNRQAQKDTQKG